MIRVVKMATLLQLHTLGSYIHVWENTNAMGAIQFTITDSSYPNQSHQLYCEVHNPIVSGHSERVERESHEKVQ